MQKQIIIDVMDDGEVIIETKGFTGAACIEETKLLKAALGEEVCRSLAPAYYQVDENNKLKRNWIPLCG